MHWSAVCLIFFVLASTAARRPSHHHHGGQETDNACSATMFGCCPDGTTPALGAQNEGCDWGEKALKQANECSLLRFGCCPDGSTPALGAQGEGCDWGEKLDKCSSSRFGCCPDGETAAGGEHAEGCDEGKSNEEFPLCSQPFSAGSCRDFRTQYYYSVKYGACTRFLYGGCGGNDNRFETKAACESRCDSPSGRAKCLLPAVKGLCPLTLTRWHFDGAAGRCQQFHYGGCMGNANRFESEADCTSECVDGIRPDTVDHTEALTDDEERPTTVVVVGNEDQYRAVCSLAVDSGERRCGQSERRYYYDIQGGVCTAFNYYGCGGNRNHFWTIDECERICSRYGSTGCRPLECGDISCATGFSIDANGCQTCDCQRDRCTDVQCPFGSECADGTCVARRLGQCPRPSLAFILGNKSRCLNDCQADYDCPDAQKCCFNGCGYACTQAVHSEVQPSVKEVPDEVMDDVEEPEIPVEQSEFPVERPEIPLEQPEVPVERQETPVKPPCDESDAGCAADECDTIDCPSGDYAKDASGCPKCVCDDPCEAIECSETEHCHDGVCIANERLRISGGQRQVLYLSLGQYAQVRCEARGEPTPTVHWSVRDIDIPADTSERVRVNAEGHLVIEDVRYADQYAYQCIAANGRDLAVRKLFIVRIHEQVEMEGMFDSSGVQLWPDLDGAKRMWEGAALELHCRASGRPQPTIEWWKDGSPIERNHRRTFHNGTLSIPELSTLDAGIYQCVANNHFTDARAAVWITVQANSTESTTNAPDRNVTEVDRSVDHSKLDSNASMEEAAVDHYALFDASGVRLPTNASKEYEIGQRLELHCRNVGAVESVGRAIEWQKDAELLSGNEHRQIENGTLTIAQLSASDAGQYECRYRGGQSRVRITLSAPSVPDGCIDYDAVTNCDEVVKARLCANAYYNKFCCESCFHDGQ